MKISRPKLSEPVLRASDWLLNSGIQNMGTDRKAKGGVSAWYEMQIDRCDHITLRVHLLLPRELAENAQLVETTRDSFNQIHLQDIPACEGIQAGMQSRIWAPGRLSLQEATLHRFHRLLANAVTTPRDTEGAKIQPR